MINSIARLKNSAENSSIEEWKHFYKSSASRKLRIIQDFRDPLRKCSFRGEQIVAVFGYFIDHLGVNLVYFWEEDFKSIRVDRIDLDSKTSKVLKFAILLGTVNEQNPTMKTVVSFLEETLKAEIPYFEELFSGLNVYWSSFGEMKFACLYRDSGEDCEINRKTEHVSSSSLLECLAFHFDYFKIRSPIWNVAPMRYLFQGTRKSHSNLIKLHLHPKCFQPVSNLNEGQFFWPWQKCLSSVNDGELEYCPIETTSLVFDLRKSTIAMEQLPQKSLGAFSPFIKSIVKSAKEIVFSHGGFFDKETGDGLVAHFVGFDQLDEAVQGKCPNQRAFEAGVDIIRECGRICDDFQKQLNFGVGALGAAVGIHTGSAVWVSEDNHVRAIGESVIVASRLCSEAADKNIFISNKQFSYLSPCINTNVIALFQERLYRGKEVDVNANLFGYSIRIEDKF